MAYKMKTQVNGQLLFASIPREQEPSPAQEEAWETIEIMKRQMQAIELSETPTGKHHFDVPKGGGHGKQKKDLYSAFLFAARCVYDHLWSEGLPENIMHHEGVMRPRQRGNASFESQEDALGQDIPPALRDKLEIAEDPEAYKQKKLHEIYNRRHVITAPSAAVLSPKPRKKGK